MGDFRWGGLKDVGTAPNADYAATVPHILYCIYQLMFAIITPALISGAVVGRMKLGSWCVFVVIWHVIVYDFVAHLVWSGWTELDPTTGTIVNKTGWLRSLGALDFAGGTVVHITSGFSALAASFVLGKRKIVIDNPNFEDRPYKCVQPLDFCTRNDNS
jgi:ammonium transporter, Amt family